MSLFRQLHADKVPTCMWCGSSCLKFEAGGQSFTLSIKGPGLSLLLLLLLLSPLLLSPLLLAGLEPTV